MSSRTDVTRTDDLARMAPAGDGGLNTLPPEMTAVLAEAAPMFAETIAQTIVSVTQPTARRLTLDPAEAAASLGVSRTFFDEHVKPELRVVRRGRLVLIPVKELERWVDDNAARALD